MKLAADQMAGGTIFGATAQSSKKRAQAAGSVGEAFGAGWFGGSLFNAAFIDIVANEYADGKSGWETGGPGVASGQDITATAALSDTLCDPRRHRQVQPGGSERDDSDPLRDSLP